MSEGDDKQVRWTRIKDLFGRAIPLELKERRALLAEAAGEDPSLAEEVGKMLDAHDVAERDGWLSMDDRSSADPVVDPLIGARIGAYEVIREIGRGGMGAVYLAQRADGGFQQQVAIKILRRGLSAEMHDRFLHEREILASLQHPNLAQLLDGGSTDDLRPYFVMEYVEGHPITDYCDERRLAMDQRIGLFRKVCDALSYAHRNLVVHRDIKPGNILVTGRGEVKLLDFGIAKLIDSSRALGSAPQTRTGMQLLTPEYASPEQVSGAAVTTVSDVYQLGVLLYEMLTGRRPYRMDSRIQNEIMRVILNESPTRPSTAVAEVVASDSTEPSQLAEVCAARNTTPIGLQKRLVGDLDNIILKALRKEPDRRYESVDKLSEDLHRHLVDLPVFAQPDSRSYRLRKFVARNRIGVFSAAAIAALLTAVAAISIWAAITTSRQAELLAEERDRAEDEARKARSLSDFLESMLGSADPESGGKDVTVREILDAANERIETELTPNSQEVIDIRGALGKAYLGLGLFEEAGASARKGVDEAVKGFGPESPSLAEPLNDLGLWYRAVGKADSAMIVFERALEVLRDSTGLDNWTRANSFNSLALMMDDSGDVQKADSLGRTALRLARSTNDPRLEFTITNNLASYLQTAGRYEESRELYERAMELGSDFPNSEGFNARVLNNLGALYYRLEEYEESEDLYAQSLEIRVDLLGYDHPTTLATRHNIGNLLRAKGEFVEAEKSLSETLAGKKRVLGVNHESVGFTLVPYGNVLTELGQTTEGERHLREAVRLFGEVYSMENYLVGYSRMALGTNLGKQGRTEEAGRELLQAFSILDKTLGPDHPFAKEVRERLVDHYESIGDEEEAAKYRP